MNRLSFAIDAVGGGGALKHTQFIALRSKDAIVDQFRERSGTRPDVEVERPSIRINVRVHKGRASLSLDLAGTPLHRRGWRQGTGEAPLKENLACAMLLRAGWPAIAATGGALVDPMCGAGTLLILQDVSGFARAEPEEFAAAMDTLADAADYWRGEHNALLVIAELATPMLAPELSEISYPAR